MERVQTIMSFVIPVQFAYNNKNYAAQMGPFNHSTEREFALTVNRRAIDDCTSIEQLKPVAKNLLEGWASMQTAVQSLMLENIQLRQALAKREVDLRAAEEIITQAGDMLEAMQTQRERVQQSRSARRGLWPW
jgi:sulfate adenylyltransferase subunit 1 (EFTu-like GTPase family)